MLHSLNRLSVSQKVAFFLCIALMWGAALYICLHRDNLDIKLIIPVVFLAFCSMCYFIFTCLYKIFKENMPLLYAEKRSLFGEPMSKISLYCFQVGVMHFRNFHVCAEIYRDKIVISKFNRCLLITKPEQIEIKVSFLGHSLKFQVDNCLICCYIREKQLQTIENWIKTYQ